MSATAEHMAYVGRCASCGALVCAAVDDPKHAVETRKFVREAMRDGCHIERVTCQFVRENLSPCTDSCECKFCVKRRRASERAS